MNTTKIPEGWEVLGKLQVTHNWINVLLNCASVIVFWLSIWLLSEGIEQIQLGYDFFNIFYLISSSPVLYGMITLTIAFSIFYFQTQLHERIHGACLKKYAGEEPKYGYTSGIAYAALKSGVYIDRNKAIIALIAPIIVLVASGIISLMPIPFLTSIMIYIFGLACGSCVGDILTIIWLLCYKTNSRFGFDGVASIIIGPQAPE